VGFRAPQAALNQLDSGVRSIFDVQAPFQTRPSSENTLGLFRDEFGKAGRGLKQEANRSGLSPFSQLRIGQAQQAAQSGTAKAAGQLAAQGGLRSGALERLRTAGQGQALDAQTNIALADEQRRQSSLGRLAAIEAQGANAIGGASQFDVAQRAQERQLQNARTSQERDAIRESLAAEQQARAIEEENNRKKGLFGSGISAGTLIGAGLGAFGGPAGVAVGASLGSQLNF